MLTHFDKHFTPVTLGIVLRADDGSDTTLTTESGTHLKPNPTIKAVTGRHPVFPVQSEGVQKYALAIRRSWLVVEDGGEVGESLDGVVELLSRGSQVVLLLPAVLQGLEQEWRVSCVL